MWILLLGTSFSVGAQGMILFEVYPTHSACLAAGNKALIELPKEEAVFYCSELLEAGK